MEPHSPRFADTPPGSPKSCMKGSRGKQLTFDKPPPVDVTTSSTSTSSRSEPSPGPSPKRSPKSVSIRMHDDGSDSSSQPSTSPRVTSFALPSTSREGASGGGGGGGSEESSRPVHQKKAPPPPVTPEFQFQLTEHFDQSTPPPNCTSNGNYDFDNASNGSAEGSGGDPRKDPQLVEIANRFVNEIIEKAKVEAANRAKADQSERRMTGTSEEEAAGASFVTGMGRGAAGWYRRAHGVVSKWFTNICVRAQNTLQKADLK